MSTMTADLVAGFPFPFPAPTYRYSTNVEPARGAVPTPAGQWGTAVVDVDSEYHHELRERARILAEDPSRYAALPHMEIACWDAMLCLLRELALTRPDECSLEVVAGGPRPTYRWRNDLLGIDRVFVLGEAGCFERSEVEAHLDAGGFADGFTALTLLYWLRLKG